MAARVRKAVIPVAGLGTRGLPFTKEVPKELLPIIDTPAIHFIVEEVLAAGIEQVIFITGKGKSVLEDYFDPSPALESWLRKRGKDALAEKIQSIGKMVEVISVRQKEPLGLGHAVLCAAPVVGNEPFAVCLGDEIFPPWDSSTKTSGLKQLVEAAQKLSTSVVGVLEVPREETPSYGIVDVGKVQLGKEACRVLKTVEKPSPEKAPSPYAIIGRYVFDPEIFEHLRQTKAGVGGEIQLTDGMDKLCAKERLYAQRMQGARYDIGNHLAFVKAQVDAALRHPELGTSMRAYLKGLTQ